MVIKLPSVPFKFNTPEGLMEVTVRCSQTGGGAERQLPFGATASFIGHGPRALERIPLSARAETYFGVLTALKEGFKVSPQNYDKDTPEHRALTALCRCADVTEA